MHRETREVVSLMTVSYRGVPLHEMQHLTSIAGRVYWTSQSPGQGLELHATDGTIEGTHVIDLAPGAAGSNPNHFHTMSDGTFLFSAATSEHGRELWRSDGTTVGTRLVRDIQPGIDGSDPDTFWDFNGETYFEAKTLTNGREIWKTDGTLEGTQLVIDMKPGPASGEFLPVGKIGSGEQARLLFGARTIQNRDLWTTDGSAAGTRQISVDDGKGFNLSSVESVQLGDDLYFTAYRNRDELWKASVDGLTKVTTFEPVDNPNYSNLQNLNGHIFLVAKRDDVGTERFQLATETLELQLVEDINTRSRVVFFPELAGQLDNGRYLIYSDFHSVQAADPQTGQTEQLVGMTNGNRLESFAYLNGKIYFIDNQTLWVTDGTSIGTQEVVTFPSEMRLIGRDNLFAVGDLLYFRIYENQTSKLYRTDGTAEGTSFIHSLMNVQDSIWQVRRLGNRAAFLSNGDTGLGQELWSTDGTIEGTSPILDLVPGVESPNFERDMFQFQNQLAFVADTNGGFDPGLHITDGSAEGTFTILDDRVRRILLATDDHIYFVYRDSFYGSMLWRTDGTPEGTFSLDVHNVQDALNVNGTIFVITMSNDDGSQLWSTDGTLDGTKQLNNVLPNREGRFLPFANNGRLLFLDADGPITELYETDGTAEGTEQLRFEGERFLGIRELFDANADGVYFAASSEAIGGGLFRIEPDVLRQPKVIDTTIVETDGIVTSITFTFDSNVGESLQLSDLSIIPTANNGFSSDIRGAVLTWDEAKQTATWDVSTVELAAGTHILSLNSDGIFDEHNNNLDGNGDGVTGDPFRYEFRNQLLPGDVDGNNAVDFTDFLIVSENFGKQPVSLEDGDLDGDGVVSFTDFLILSSNFGRKTE